jgi:hypothetical protein
MEATMHCPLQEKIEPHRSDEWRFKGANMYCLNCGTKASTYQKFCRACGLSLERFAQMLAETPPEVQDENVAQPGLQTRQSGIMEKIGALLLGMVITLPIVMSLFSTMSGKGNMGRVVLLLLYSALLLVVVGLMGYYTALLKRVSAQGIVQSAEPSAETTNKLLPDDQPEIATSVTERTTARLQEKIEPRRLDE